MTTRSAVEEERSFDLRVDRPFALAIRHRGSGALLFAAWVADPAGN
jgi:serine protease inhibitor